MLWSETRVDTSGEVSPDGRYLSHMADTGDLAIRDLKTGESRVLTNEGDWEKSATFVAGSRWSPDGRHIAYGWVTMPYRRERKEVWELRLTDSIGEIGKPRVLRRGDEALIPAGWFPDGKSILAVATEKTLKGAIIRISTEDAVSQVLKTVELSIGAFRAQLSPDGKYVAYEWPGEPQSLNNDILLFPTAGGSEIPVATGPSDERLLAWTPDGRHILFSSNRSGTYDAWLVRVENGKAAGTPELVKQDFGIIQPIGFAPGGEFYFGREVIIHDIFVADWNPETGKLASAPRKATEHFAGSTYWPAWSRDGKKLAYIVHRGALYRMAENQVRIRDLETGQESTVPKISSRITSLAWSPDRTSLLLCGALQAGKSACWVVDANSGNVLLEAAVPQGEQKPSRGAVWAPDGSAVYYSTWVTNEGRGRIVRRDLASGNEKILYSLDRFHNPISLTLSPDGRFLAFVLESLLEGNKALGPRIMLIPTGGGDARELVRSEEHDIGRGTIAWSPDSRHVYFARRAPDAKTDRLCRVSVSDGATEELQYETKELYELRLSPDGHQIAFTQFSKGHGEIWVMENFLPKDAKDGQ